MNPKGAGKRKADTPSRANTVGSIRGKTISHPIPFPDDDEFPIRTPGTGIAMPLGTEALEREIRLQTSTATEELHPSHPPEIDLNESTPTTTTQTTHIMSKPVRNSVAGSVQEAGRPERKKSSLRSVFGRIFGKKKKNRSSSNGKSLPDSARIEQHRSDPTALNRSPQDTSNAQKRSASLPITEFNRALRSHSIGIDDIPQSIRDNRDSIQSNNGQRRSRRVTTPNRLWTPNKTPGYMGMDWAGLSPRPASSCVRGSKVISDADANAIGTAVTSGSHPNRRSRSLGEIRDTALSITVPRRRSDEIRYWRESYDPGVMSPMSSNKAEEPILMDEEEPKRDLPPQEPPQPFNFGSMGEFAGMKITQAASIETRVNRLEERVLKMERMISRSLENLASQESSRRRSSGGNDSISRPKMENSDVSQPKNPRYRDSRAQHLHEPMPQVSYNSRPSTNSTHNSYHPSVDTFSQPGTRLNSEPPLSSSPSTVRPLSTSTTIRGLPSSSPVSKDTFLTNEHYTVLTNMILNEQTARQQLEILVSNLQEKVRVLSSSHSHDARYLAPSDRKSSLDPTGEFSSFEQDDSSDDEERYAHEVYKTPSEEPGHFGDGEGIFGDVLRNSASQELEFRKGVRDDRTLSLSQITQGKGMQHAMNFLDTQATTLKKGNMT